MFNLIDIDEMIIEELLFTKFYQDIFSQKMFFFSRLISVLILVFLLPFVDRIIYVTTQKRSLKPSLMLELCINFKFSNLKNDNTGSSYTFETYKKSIFTILNL